jgi:hypothetical protein
MMNELADYPFQAEWEQAQREPLPEFSGGFPNKPSPLTKDRLPDLPNRKTLNPQEVQNQ